MKYWLTSMDKKKHQRAMNQLVRSFNKALEKDELWCGRFVIRQVYSPQWHRYDDGSGAELFVHLKFIDRSTEQGQSRCRIDRTLEGRRNEAYTSLYAPKAAPYLFTHQKLCCDCRRYCHRRGKIDARHEDHRPFPRVSSLYNRRKS